MKLDDATIKTILVEEGYIDEAGAVAVEKLAAQQRDIIPALLAQNIITKQLLGQAIAEHYKVRYVDVATYKINDDIFFAVPEAVAFAQSLVALDKKDEGVVVGMVDPTNTEMVDVLEKKFGSKVVPHFALPGDVAVALKRYAANLEAQFAELVDQMNALPLDSDDRNKIITQLVDTVLAAGMRNNASDVHLDPEEKHVQVRFRIDGLLHDVLTIEKPLYEYLLSRIKILSKMRTDEHRAAQDGKFRFTSSDDEVVDIRVSVVPTTSSENVVMRLLSGLNKHMGLTDLGLGELDFQKVAEAVRHPHGMILVTGPTGSGKTTTLYALLHMLNQREVHISTIEDPVEYNIDGITQIQVNTKTNLTFAQGLRAIVRQDPDIIMVGEIRDEETASIAVNSALTGHLVLSTLHTNDAATTLPRLLDMGVEVFLVASTINVVIAQRLVRKNCQSCVASYTVGDQEKKLIKSNSQISQLLKKMGVTAMSKIRLYKGSGCKVCSNTGYNGRIGVFEVLEINDELRDLVMQHANADQIKDKAVELDMTTMMEDALQKMLNGETTLEEVIRVTLE